MPMRYFTCFECDRPQAFAGLCCDCARKLDAARAEYREHYGESRRLHRECTKAELEEQEG